ncbi:hypothetical protein [Rhizobium mesoamericanum]|uniref:hypothetical protein n=1 Tax=Rhizobium mesoamericanum TaxID=1079800 RepID=UPI00040C3536|nr:hypothetical protein [Rhizobium mesoamericanum]
MDSFRHAHRADLTDIIEMLSDDDLGATREIVSDLLNARYIVVFEATESDAYQPL